MMAGGDTVVRGNWWGVSSRSELCIVCKIWTRSVRGWIGCLIRML